MCQRLWMQIHRQSRTQPKIYIKRKSILCQHCSNNSIKSAFTAFQRFVDQLVLMENNVGTSYQHYLKGDIHNSLNISNEYTGRYSDAYAINKDLKVYISKSTASLHRSKRSRKFFKSCQKCFATKDLLQYHLLFHQHKKIPG